jgi:hypothetical protein
MDNVINVCFQHGVKMDSFHDDTTNVISNLCDACEYESNSLLFEDYTEAHTEEDNQAILKADFLSMVTDLLFDDD